LTYIAANTALDEFAKDVDRVEQLLSLIHVFREFAGQDAEPSGYAHDLWTAAQSVRTDLPILSGSLLLYLCGRFEYFVRELVSTIVDDLVDRAAKYADLPIPLRKEYLTRTLLINQNPNKFNYTSATASALAAELANNLAGKDDGGSGLRVDAATITITEANMNSLVLDGLFKRVAIDKPWDTLGKQLPLRRYLGEVTEQECKKAAMTRLDDIMTERNRVAHPTSATAFPDAKAVEDTAEYFRVLAQVLVELALAPR
jgi:hypothetical protein